MDIRLFILRGRKAVKITNKFIFNIKGGESIAYPDGIKYCHGLLMTITSEEYDRLLKRYGIKRTKNYDLIRRIYYDLRICGL